MIDASGPMARGAIEELATDQIPVVQMASDFGLTDESLSAWLQLEDPYNPASHPVPVTVVGPTLNLARRHADASYYAKTKLYVESRLETDPAWLKMRSRAHELVTSWFGSAPLPLPTPWGDAFWGAVRTISDGAPPHWDNLNDEWSASAWTMPRLTRQYAINFFLRAAPHGDELLL
jgi:hypothetical protein